MSSSSPYPPTLPSPSQTPHFRTTFTSDLFPPLSIDLGAPLSPGEATLLLSSLEEIFNHTHADQSLASLNLQYHPFVAVEPADLVEVVLAGNVQLGIISSIVRPNVFNVSLLLPATTGGGRVGDSGSDSHVLCDVQQLRAVWKQAAEGDAAASAVHTTEDGGAKLPSIPAAFAPSQLLASLSPYSIQENLELLWRRNRRSKVRLNSSAMLTRSEIAACPNARLAALLRSASKRHGTVVTSAQASHALFFARGDAVADTSRVAASCEQDQDRTRRRRERGVAELLAGAQALHVDGSTVGRFHKMPCVPLGFDKEGRPVLLNGGWVAVDDAMRQVTESIKLVERNKNPTTTLSKGPKCANGGDRAISTFVTKNEEKIIRRLERLAMGLLFAKKQQHQEHSKAGFDAAAQKKVDINVREVLLRAGHPVSALGAQQYLLDAKYWSTSRNLMSAKRLLIPWSGEVLAAASGLANIIAERRKRYREDRSVVEEEGRVDLTMFPSFCIDSDRTSFRDDAVGIRPRPDGGWELLVHVVDVSSIFSPAPSPSSMACPPAADAGLLRAAAKMRGVSRYDLPVGALHLLPPKALEALTFCKGVGSVTECLTVWAHVDETGVVRESGVERSIAKPEWMSFRECDKRLVSGSAASVADVSNQLSPSASASSPTSSLSPPTSASTALLLQIERLLSAFASRRPPSPSPSLIRGRSELLVDSALDLYSKVALGSLRAAGAPAPQNPGTRVWKGGRLATSPLRRHIDAMAQRQILANVCGFGTPLSDKECEEESLEAGSAGGKWPRLPQ